MSFDPNGTYYRQLLSGSAVPFSLPFGFWDSFLARLRVSSNVDVGLMICCLLSIDDPWHAT